MGIIPLTKNQTDLIEWAIDVMPNFWCTEDGAHERGGKMYGEEALPILSVKGLTLDHCPEEIVSDLHYRITEQHVDMAEFEGRHQTVAMCYRIGDKITEARPDMKPWLSCEV